MYPDYFFEEYWKKRQYKHPEEGKKEKHIAKKFYSQGFRTAEFLINKERKEATQINKEAGK